MAVMLPGEVAHFLQMLGFDWPEGNEDRVFEYAQQWMTFGGKVSQLSSGGEQIARQLGAQSDGAGFDAFRQRFDDHAGPTQVARDMGTGLQLGGGMLVVMAGAIVALKIVVVVQVVQFAITFAEAVAAAIPTFGASLSLIPIAELIAQKAIEFGINVAIEKLLGGA